MNLFRANLFHEQDATDSLLVQPMLSKNTTSTRELSMSIEGDKLKVNIDLDEINPGNYSAKVSHGALILLLDTPLCNMPSTDGFQTSDWGMAIEKHGDRFVESFQIELPCPGIEKIESDTCTKGHLEICLTPSIMTSN